MRPHADGAEAFLHGEVDVIFAEVGQDAEFRFPGFRLGYGRGGCKAAEDCASGHDRAWYQLHGEAFKLYSEDLRKSTPEEIRARFDNDVERFSNLETGQSAAID